MLARLMYLRTKRNRCTVLLGSHDLEMPADLLNSGLTAYTQ